MKIKITFIFIFIVTYIAQANLGIIQGAVVSGTSGERIIGAYVYVNDSTGTTTDLDGNYRIELPAGIYNLKFTYLGYSDYILEKVQVQAGQVVTLNVRLGEVATKLAEVIVTGRHSQQSEAAVLTLQKRSPALLDGISSEAFNKLGDGNAAMAIRRVPGITIEEGKYLYVRGLGDRYSKVTFNGVTIPGLDPDKNTLQMDMFSTSLIDNIIVYKTFTPDLDGDFTGGLVNIVTRDFPIKKTIKTSININGNPKMNFNKNFIGYEHGAYDWAGFAGKKRMLPFHTNTNIPDETANNPKLYQYSNSFNKELGVRRSAPSFINQGYSFSFGNQYDKKNYTLGVNLIANYSNSYSFYQGVKQGIYFKHSNRNIVNLDKREISIGNIGRNDVLWNVLGGIAIKNNNNKLGFTVIHSQNGIGQAGEFISHNFDETSATLYKNAIDYSQKSVTNLLISGKHNFRNAKLSLGWKISPSFSSILDPDVRSTSLSYDEEDHTYSLKMGEGAGINRYFRYLNEFNLATKTDLKLSLKNNRGKTSQLKFGVSNIVKRRSYAILLYQFNRTSDFNHFTGNFNEILETQNLWTSNKGSGMYVIGNRDRNNQYLSLLQVSSGYMMHSIDLLPALKANYGVRAEWATMHYNGYYNNKPLNDWVHNKLSLLPSVNLIYELLDQMNLRASFTKTLARPSFKEKSNAHIDDPISQTVFIGNINLKETSILNYDLRLEYYRGKQMLSLSTFYKQFVNPIELVPFQLNPNNIQPKNIASATVYGAEFELRKNMTPPDAAVFVNLRTNLTYIVSQVDTRDIIVDINGKTEYELRVNNARITESGEDEKVKPIRSMQGQAPYIINSSLNFSHRSSGLHANISYNVQGDKLLLVGSGIVPDVYEAPFHRINVNAGVQFGKKNNINLSIGVKNVLSNSVLQYYSSFEAKKEVYKSYQVGRNYFLSISYTPY